jgi:hypothetical protein
MEAFLPPAPNQQHLFPAVLLRHDLPDSSHLDLLIAGAEPGLWAARLAQDVVWQSDSEFFAQPIARHREHYLRYEGPVQGGALGTVARLRSGLGCVESSIESGGPVLASHLTLTLWWPSMPAPRSWRAACSPAQPLLHFLAL